MLDAQQVRDEQGSHIIIPALANASTLSDLDYQGGECDVDQSGRTNGVWRSLPVDRRPDPINWSAGASFAVVEDEIKFAAQVSDLVGHASARTSSRRDTNAA
jgi:hypothetical protein